MASVPVSAAYVKQLQKNALLEKNTQNNSIELAGTEDNLATAQQARPFYNYFCNTQTMLQSSLQRLFFFPSEQSEQRFKERADRP